MPKCALMLVLTIATTSVARGQSTKDSPVVCVHVEGAWHAKDATFTVSSFSDQGCDVATASRTYAWTKDDADDFGGMVTAQGNLLAFTSGCLQEMTSSKKSDCDRATRDLMATSLHAARASRESLCSRHPNWWVVSINDSGSFGKMESCGD